MKPDKNLDHPSVLSSDSLDTLKNMVEGMGPFSAIRGRDESNRFKRIDSPPILVEEGYRNYNIVKYKGKYFALHQKLGKFDLATMNLSEMGKDAISKPPLKPEVDLRTTNKTRTPS